MEGDAGIPGTGSHVSQNRRDVGHPAVAAVHTDVVEGYAAVVTLLAASEQQADRNFRSRWDDTASGWADETGIQ
jgi:hypothetical protein